MDGLRQILDRIAKQLSGLNLTQKLLVGSLVVIALMGMYLVTQFAGQRDMVPLMDTDPSRDMVAVLRASHIDAEVRGNQVFVPVSSQRLALASLAENGSLPGDTQVLFNNLIEHQKWTNSREQNQQQFDIALQNELARIIGYIGGIKSANILIDAPKTTGIGLVAREPTASATIVTTGEPLHQKTADTIASLIAGAKSGLNTANVQVIDANSGRTFRVSDDGDVGASAYLEHATAVEKRMRGKLLELYSYIPGVIVAVTAHVDIAREDVRTEAFRSVEEGGTVSLLGNERTSGTSQNTPQRGGEPGLRSNTSASINRGSAGAGTNSEMTETETTMENHVGRTTTHRLDPKGQPTRLVASIQIPRNYVNEILKAGLAEDAEAPTEDAIKQKFEEIRLEMESKTKPHLQTEQTDGEVTVSMIPIAFRAAGAQQASIFGGIASGGGGTLGLGGNMLETGIIGVLGLVSVALMVMMVRRAGKQVKMPTAEELIGLPPELGATSDLVGDVGEGEDAMAGLELNDDDIEFQKMLGEVVEQANHSPESVASVLNRWITQED